MLNYLAEIDHKTPDFGDFYDEAPLWSARFGLLLLEQVRMRRGMTILDMGAGTGFLSIELAQRCGADSTVIAVDPWESAMRRLARKAEFLGLQNIRSVVQDGATIDLPDQSVDLIISNLGINNFENGDAVFATCFRVAKRDAQLILTTNLVGHMAEFYESYCDTLCDFGRADLLGPLESHVQHRGTLDEVQARIERAGFEVVGTRTQVFHERFADGSACLRHWFIRLGFLSAWKGLAGDLDCDQFFAALEKRLNVIAVERGELALTIPAVCIEARKPGEPCSD